MATKKKAGAPAPAVKEEPKTVKRAPKCDHVFIGTSDGVRCTKCGITMTADEFIKSIE